MRRYRRWFVAAACGVVLAATAPATAAFADFDNVFCVTPCATPAIASHSSQHWIIYTLQNSGGGLCSIWVRDVSTWHVVAYDTQQGRGVRQQTVYGLYGWYRAEGTGNNCSVGVSNFT